MRLSSSRTGPPEGEGAPIQGRAAFHASPLDYRYRWLTDVPLRGDADALTVNWLMIEIVNATGAVTYRNSFITDLPVGPDTVADLAACGRARWKIENEKLQCPEEQRLPSRAQLRARESQSFRRVRVPEPARFRLPYRLRSGRRSVAQGDEARWEPAAGFSKTCDPSPPSSIFPTWDDLLATLAFARPPPTAL